jgi:hypothetical protein
MNPVLAAVVIKSLLKGVKKKLMVPSLGPRKKPQDSSNPAAFYR